MIDRIHLVNFKNHADTQIELGRLTALIGPNSSGKTNVLQALFYSRRLVSESMNTVFKGASDPEVVVRDGQKSFNIGLDGKAETMKGVSNSMCWSISVAATKAILEGGREGWIPDIKWKWGEEDDGYSESDLAWNYAIKYKAPSNFIQALGRATYLKLVSNNLKEPSYVGSIRPRMESDGSGLATTVAYLMTSEPERFLKLIESLRSVVPDVGQVRVRPAKVKIPERRSIKVEDKMVSFDDERIVFGDELIFDMAGAQEVPAHSVSEGTLLALGLLTLLWSPDCPNLVLFDDIEQGLHPKAQRELIAQLRKILEQRPELQIVLTSHSPYIVDELEAEEVWLLATDKAGIAHAQRLSDHPEADQWLKVLTTGEFWSAEGEEWVVSHGE